MDRDESPRCRTRRVLDFVLFHLDLIHATRRCHHLLALFATGFIALFAKPLAAPRAPLIVDRQGHEIVFRSHRRQPVLEMQKLVLAHDEPAIDQLLKGRFRTARNSG